MRHHIFLFYELITYNSNRPLNRPVIRRFEEYRTDPLTFESRPRVVPTDINPNRILRRPPGAAARNRLRQATIAFQRENERVIDLVDDVPSLRELARRALPGLSRMSINQGELTDFAYRPSLI